LLELQAKLQPDPTIASTDDYRDFGIDASYEYLAPPTHGLQGNFSYVRENRTLNQSASTGAASFINGNLNSLNVNATYAYRQTWAVTLAYFNITGTTDLLLYAPTAVTGSASASPDSGGYIVNVEWIPFGKLNSWARPYANVRTGLQYTIYTRFNGGSSDYDGNGRSASQNNTLYGYIWIAF
jgi:hypothetical protein